MKDNKYNGWTNYKTWNFNLWITNDEEDYEYALELAEESENKYELSKRLEEWAVDMADDCISTEIGFIVDMIYSSIKEINFYEVATHLWKDITQRTKERSELWGEE
jgi:hypothetical protein